MTYAGVNVTRRLDSGGIPPLSKLVEMIIKTAFPDCGKALLHMAGRGDLEWVRRLVEVLNIDTEIRDSHKSTPLHCAANFGQLEIVRYLTMEAKANVDSRDEDGSTPLHSATWRGQLDVVKHLVKEAKADVDAIDDYGNTPLLLAACGDIKIARYLVQSSFAMTSDC